MAPFKEIKKAVAIPTKLFENILLKKNIRT